MCLNHRNILREKKTISCLIIIKFFFVDADFKLSHNVNSIPLSFISKHILKSDYNFIKYLVPLNSIIMATIYMYSIVLLFWYYRR